ncbi:hypothetical protein B5807_01392 [Epicoccum nigrum]|uniref:Uncharacterized protein n=1 Tax=Epicoccum nigrum TaxID=105696 RepID=A0A1Y2ME23_EPING|nr:hypothetical protein B5807_01392 [Epicoccum nigrum]
MALMQRPTEILLSSAAGSNNAPRENGRACIPAAVCSYWLPGQSPPLTKACHSPPLWRQPSPPAPVRLDLTPALQRMGVGVGVAMGDTLPACLPMLPLPLPLPASAGSPPLLFTRAGACSTLDASRLELKERAMSLSLSLSEVNVNILSHRQCLCLCCPTPARANNGAGVAGRTNHGGAPLVSLEERGRPDGWVSVPISDPATSILDDLE